MNTFTKYIFRTFFIILCLSVGGRAFGQTVYDWTDLGGTQDWKTPGNWRIGAAVATTYPGQNTNTDQVQFAVNYFYGVGQRPDIALGDSISVASVTIGDNTSSNGSQSSIYVKVDGKLNVTGTILQTHSNNSGKVGDGTLTYPTGYNYSIQTYLYGPGKVYCQTFQVGDNTLSLVNGINNITRFNLGDGNVGNGLTTVVRGNVIVNSITKNDPSTHAIISVSNANFGIYSGTLTINGQMRLQNTGDINYTTTQFQPQARFSMLVFNNNTTSKLILNGATALWAQPIDPTYAKYGSNYFDFFIGDRQTMLNNDGGNVANPVTLATPDKTVVSYSGNTDQVVYTNGSFPIPPGNPIFDANGGAYEYLEFGGSGKKTFDATAAAVDFTISGNITLNPGTEVVDLSTNNPKLVLNNSNIKFTSTGSSGTLQYTIPIASSFTSGAGSTFQNGSVALTIPGTTSNGGTFNTSASTVVLTGAFTNTATGIFNQTGASPVTASSTTTNAGIYNQGGSGALTFTGALTNSGSINQTSSGTVTASNTTTNTGTYTQNGTGIATFTGPVDKQGIFNDTNTGAINVNNTFTNSLVASLFNQSAGTINFNNTYSNTGTFKATAGTVNLNQSGAQGLTDNSAAGKGTTFFNLNVQNGGTKTMTVAGAGQFYVASTGTLNMISTTDLASANTALTLVSDVNGAATVTAVPADCHITGNVTVQRYVSANRAYRLVSSPVYTAAAAGNNIYSINYLLTNTYLTGSGSGFDKSGNPTLYLYRENIAPQYTTFVNSNFRGISDIASPPNYLIDSDPGTFNIPVGSGYLFYFRGSRKQASLAALTTAGAGATTDTLNAVGVLNQQSVTVHDWYTPASANLGYTTVSADPTIYGMNLVGNPYASSIDWDQLGTGIIQTQVSPFSYKLIANGSQGSGNYDVYQAGTPGKTGTRGTANANIIASGEGFFVKALDATASLTFTEAAKTNTLVTGANLYMGKPVVASVPEFIRLQLALDTINTDGIIINFDNSAKATYSPAEDAFYKIGTGKVSLSSFSSDNVALAINRLPLVKTTIIPLNVGFAADGTYKLNTQALSGIPQLYNVWLKDSFKKDSVNLRTTASYSFTVAKADPTTFGSNRFSIVLSENPAMVCQVLSFNAQKTDGRQVQVVWTAKNEENYTHFTVERSIDNGKTFEVVGGLSSSGQGTYSLLDKSPSNGQNIYRLKQENIDNSISYSKPVQIEYTAKSNSLTNGRLNVYPNPVSGTINLNINPKNPEAATYQIRITNSAGLVVKQASTTQTSWQASAGDLYTGTYLVQVISNKDNSVVGQTKFVKL